MTPRERSAARELPDARVPRRDAAPAAKLWAGTVFSGPATSLRAGATPVLLIIRCTEVVLESRCGAAGDLLAGGCVSGGVRVAGMCPKPLLASASSWLALP